MIFRQLPRCVNGIPGRQVGQPLRRRGYRNPGVPTRLCCGTAAGGSRITDACLSASAMGSSISRIPLGTRRTHGNATSHAGRTDERCSKGPSGSQRTSAPCSANDRRDRPHHVAATVDVDADAIHVAGVVRGQEGDDRRPRSAGPDVAAGSRPEPALAPPPNAPPTWPSRAPSGRYSGQQPGNDLTP